MRLFNRKSAENTKELTPEQKVARALQAINRYIKENENELSKDTVKMKKLRNIYAEAEELSKGDVNEAQAHQLVEKTQAEGIQVDLETPAENEDAPKTKKFNKKMAAYIAASLLALGAVGGWIYAYNSSDKKDKTEQVDKKEDEKDKTDKKEDGKKDASKWGNISPTDASYQDQMKELEEIAARNAAIKELVDNTK